MYGTPRRFWPVLAVALAAILVLTVHLAVGDHGRDRLHDGVVWPDRVGGDDVDVGQTQRVCDGFRTGDEKLFFTFERLG